MNKAHTLSAKERTLDIFTDGITDFESLLLSPNVLEGLKETGFYQPSPIQLQAIPLAKCGLDLICQAKSGTGKTCVFAVCALEAVDTKTSAMQVLVLAPTREIAHQIYSVVMNIGVKMTSLKCCLLIGGIPIDQDIINMQGCQIAVGTPGRIKHHIEAKNLLTESIRLFVLDEADKLLEEGSFQQQINWIFSTLETHKQVLALSATYPESLAQFLTNYMQDPVHVRINPEDLTLKGISQFYTAVQYNPLPHKAFQDKCSKLLNIIQQIPFQQCMVFSNYQTRAEELSRRLNRQGWPCTYIAGSQNQSVRLQAMNRLKNYDCRILITTDLTSRGIDCDKVNLVINLDLPWDTDTYLHRIGRAGRFGSYGLAISIVTEGEEYKKLLAISDVINKKILFLAADHDILSSIKAQEELQRNSHEESKTLSTTDTKSESKIEMCNGQKDETVTNSELQNDNNKAAHASHHTSNGVHIEVENPATESSVKPNERSVESDSPCNDTILQEQETPNPNNEQTVELDEKDARFISTTCNLMATDCPKGVLGTPLGRPVPTGKEVEHRELNGDESTLSTESKPSNVVELDVISSEDTLIKPSRNDLKLSSVMPQLQSLSKPETSKEKMMSKSTEEKSNSGKPVPKYLSLFAKHKERKLAKKAEAVKSAPHVSESPPTTTTNTTRDIFEAITANVSTECLDGRRTTDDITKRLDNLSLSNDNEAALGTVVVNTDGACNLDLIKRKNEVLKSLGLKDEGTCNPAGLPLLSTHLFSQSNTTDVSTATTTLSDVDFHLSANAFLESTRPFTTIDAKNGASLFGNSDCENEVNNPDLQSKSRIKPSVQKRPRQFNHMSVSMALQNLNLNDSNNRTQPADDKTQSTKRVPLGNVSQTANNDKNTGREERIVIFQRNENDRLSDHEDEPLFISQQCDFLNKDDWSYSDISSCYEKEDSFSNEFESETNENSSDYSDYVSENESLLSGSSACFTSDHLSTSEVETKLQDRNKTDYDTESESESETDYDSDSFSDDDDDDEEEGEMNEYSFPENRHVYPHSCWNQDYFVECYHRAYINHVNALQRRTTQYNPYYYHW